MIIFLFFVFFITLVPTTASIAAGLPSSSTLAVDKPQWTVSTTIQPRRNHDYDDNDDNDDDEYHEDDDGGEDEYDDNEGDGHVEKGGDGDEDGRDDHGKDGWDDDNGDDDQQDKKHTSSSPHKLSSSQTSWQADSATTYITLSAGGDSSTPSSSWASTTSLAVPAAPVANPSATISPEKASLIASQVIKARQRAVEASANGSSMSWHSPRPGDAFAAGTEIVLQWGQQEPDFSHLQLRLCVLRSAVDLPNAQSGVSTDGDCGMAVEADSVVTSDGTGYQVSFGAPSVSTADSFFIVMSANAAPLATNHADNKEQKRDVLPSPQLVSPAFVLAPQGVDLSTLNALQSAPSPSATSTMQPQQAQQQLNPDSSRRPIAWSWVVGPIIAVLCILVVCALVYSHRKGRRSARAAALQERRQGEEKWREDTRKEVDDLSESTLSHAARWSHISLPSQPSSPVMRKAVPRDDRSSGDDEPYYSLSSNVSAPKGHPKRSSTIRAPSSLAADQMCHSSARSSNTDAYTYLPSRLGQIAQRSQRKSAIYPCSSDESVTSSPSLCALSIRHIAPYDDQDNCKTWTSTTGADTDSSSQSEGSDIFTDSHSTLVPAPIPAALLPRSETNAAMSNPHEVVRRPLSLPAMPSRPCTSHTPSRVLSFSAAEASTTTGRRGTAYDFVDTASMERADHVNALYLQLKQALQQSPSGNIQHNTC